MHHYIPFNIEILNRGGSYLQPTGRGNIIGSSETIKQKLNYHKTQIIINF